MLTCYSATHCKKIALVTGLQSCDPLSGSDPLAIGRDAAGVCLPADTAIAVKCANTHCINSSNSHCELLDPNNSDNIAKAYATEICLP